MQLSALTSQLEGQSATAGWDAICAINVANLNNLFLRWYLANGPTNPDTPVQLIFQASTSFYLLDAVLGPPEISFQVGGGIQQGQISMIVTSGVLVEFNPGSSVVQNAIMLQPDVASISGTVDLSKATGTAALGDVVLQLGSGAYTPTISGVQKESLQATELGAAMQTYFANNGIMFHLGGVTTASVPACLQPTTFEFVVQPNPATPGDGCVLLLIQTNGKPGVVGELASYPIPEGYTAALLVSNQVLFNQLFPPQLTNSKTGITFAPNWTGSAYNVKVSSGSLDLGVLSYDDAPGQPYSSNGKFAHWYSTSHESEDVTISFVGLTLEPSGGKLVTAYNSTWTQGWAYINQSGMGPSYPGDSYETAQTSLSWDASAPVTLTQPSTCNVTFPWSGSPTCTSQLDQNLLGGFGQVDPGGLIAQYFTNNLGQVFTALTAASVDTFALQNLLFYPNHTLNLPGGSLPCDLLLTGSAVPELAVSPASVSIAPGGASQQFTAALNGGTASNVVWEIVPRLGEMSPSGLYTPPPHIAKPTVVKVTATDGNDSGSALILLYSPNPSNGLTVGPPSLIMTAGQSFDFTVTESNGNAATVAWTLDPPSPAGGTMVNVFGSWQYTAPSTVTQPTTVSLKATSTTNSGQYGTSTVTLLPPSTVQITPATSGLGPGGSVKLTANVSAGVPALTWLIYPAGTGTISANGANATYTAPSSVSQQTTVQIVAYGVDDQGAGIGIASVVISPS